MPQRGYSAFIALIPQRGSGVQPQNKCERFSTIKRVRYQEATDRAGESVQSNIGIASNVQYNSSKTSTILLQPYQGLLFIGSGLFGLRSPPETKSPASWWQTHRLRHIHFGNIPRSNDPDAMKPFEMAGHSGVSPNRRLWSRRPEQQFLRSLNDVSSDRGGPIKRCAAVKEYWLWQINESPISFFIGTRT